MSHPDLEQRRMRDRDEKIRDAVERQKKIRIEKRIGNRSYEKDLYGELSAEIGDEYRRDRPVFPTLGPNRKQRRAARRRSRKWPIG